MLGTTVQVDAGYFGFHPPDLAFFTLRDVKVAVVKGEVGWIAAGPVGKADRTVVVAVRGEYENLAG